MLAYSLFATLTALVLCFQGVTGAGQMNQASRRNQKRADKVVKEAHHDDMEKRWSDYRFYNDHTKSKLPSI